MSAKIRAAIARLNFLKEDCVALRDHYKTDPRADFVIQEVDRILALLQEESDKEDLDWKPS